MDKYDEIVSSCSNLIYMIINKYFKGYDKEDLYQVGVIGLIKAYNNYKENKEAKFSTYAYKYIYGEIYAYIYSDNVIKNSKENIILYKKIKEASNILSQKLMKVPTLEELARFLEMDISIIKKVKESIYTFDSLDRVISDSGKDISLGDTIKDNKDYYDINYLQLNDELNKLEKEERKLIYLRYYCGKSQTEVADIFGINQVQVSRNEKKTLKKIKANYQNVA